VGTKVQLLFDLSKLFNGFSVICGDSIRLFVINSFGSLLRYHSVICDRRAYSLLLKPSVIFQTLGEQCLNQIIVRGNAGRLQG